MGTIATAGTAFSVGGTHTYTAVGTYVIAVSIRDAGGSTAATSLTAMVAFNICVLYDQTKAAQSGSTIPITLELCDAQGANLSSATLVLHATAVIQLSTSTSGQVQAAGNANPDSDFRFDSGVAVGGGYIFNLKTTGLTTGTYALTFTVSGDPVTHTVQFQVR